MAVIIRMAYGGDLGDACNGTCKTWSNISESTYDLDNIKTWMGQIAYNLDFYLTPILVVVGITGNTISLLVFLFTSIKVFSSSVYLAALAISDNGFLLCVLGGWLINVGFSFYEYQGLCQIFIYLTYVFGYLSVWYVVAFTVERFVAVCYPLRRHEMCTCRRAKIVVGALAVSAVVLYSPVLWTTNVDDSLEFAPEAFCHIIKRFQTLSDIVNYVDTAITLVIPFLAIALLNIKIIYQLISSNRQQVTQNRGTNLKGELISLDGRLLPCVRDRRANQNTQITRILLVVSTTFLILNLPSHVLRFHLFVMEERDPARDLPAEERNFTTQQLTDVINYEQLKILFQHIYYLNFCINFTLYSICGQNFRKALKKLVCRGRHATHWTGHQSAAASSSTRRSRLVTKSSSFVVE